MKMKYNAPHQNTNTVAKGSLLNDKEKKSIT